MSLRLIVTYGRPFKINSEQDRAMSGIQTALLALCNAFGRLGHEVHLFAECRDPGLHDGVHFHGRGEFARFTATGSADVLIVIPELLPLIMPVRARARVVWTLNAFTSGDCALAVPWTGSEASRSESAPLYPMALLRQCIDRVVVGSRWQASHQAAASGHPESQFTVAYLGVSLESYRGGGPTRYRHRLVYTSQARRGLADLLRLFPRVRAEFADAELHIFGCEYKKTATHQAPGASQPGVFWRGAVSKSALAHELRAAAVMAYPCTFKETFCLAVAEAQAAGLPVVTSDKAALAERVSDGVDGFLIGGRPGNLTYDAEFVAAVGRLLREDELWQRQGAEAARKAHRLYDWDAIAVAWVDELHRLIAGRKPLLPPPGSVPDWLEPSALRVFDGSASTHVPADVAVQGLREAWASYGYEPSDVPGLPRCPDPITKRFSLNNDSGAELPQVEHESMLSDDAASVAAESIHSNPYVFLVGCPRSGTTLLQRMVDAHPQLAITHELHWIPRYFNDRVGLTPEGNVTPHLIPSLLEHKRFSMAQLGITQEELQGLVAGEAPVSFASFVTRLFTLYGRRRGKSFAGDKTPGYVKELPTLHALWPWAKFVHIIRDGRDVCLSMLQWSEQDQFTGRLTTWTEDPVSTLALWWQLHVHLGREAGEVLGPGVYYEVHYEDLVARPGEVCARLCAFLDVPYDEAMLRFHEGRTRANPGLDAKDVWQPVTAGLSDWKAQMPAEEVERFEAAAGGLLAQLKYPRGCPDPSPEAMRQAARIRHLYRSDAKSANERLIR